MDNQHKVYLGIGAVLLILVVGYYMLKPIWYVQHAIGDKIEELRNAHAVKQEKKYEQTKSELAEESKKLVQTTKAVEKALKDERKRHSRTQKTTQQKIALAQQRIQRLEAEAAKATNSNQLVRSLRAQVTQWRSISLQRKKLLDEKDVLIQTLNDNLLTKNLRISLLKKQVQLSLDRINQMKPQRVSWGVGITTGIVKPWRGKMGMGAAFGLTINIQI